MPASTPDTADMVNAPPHYTRGSVECIDAIRSALGDEAFVAYCRGNVLKYAWRVKTDLAQDLRKAAWYAEHAAAVLEKTARDA